MTLEKSQNFTEFIVAAFAEVALIIMLMKMGMSNQAATNTLDR